MTTTPRGLLWVTTYIIYLMEGKAKIISNNKIIILGEKLCLSIDLLENETCNDTFVCT